MLSYGYLQAYLNIKRSICCKATDLLATKGIIIVALALPKTKANTSIYTKAKY